MLKLYKDLTISYFLTALVGAFTLCLIIGAFASAFVSVVLAILWVLFCAKIFNTIASRRFNSIVSVATDTCETENGLNHLFNLYKGRLNSKLDLSIAIHICSLLLHFGKNESALKLLLPYDPEALFQLKREVTYKYFYYRNLTICYSRLNKKEEALNAYNKSDELLNSPYFNKTLKADDEAVHKINYLLINDDGNRSEELLSLLDNVLTKSKNLLAEVSCRFSIICVLAKCGRLEEAQEHISFIKENGGDTVYAKCARQNDFSREFLNGIDCAPWSFDPIKTKTYKILIISITLAVLMVALTTVFGILTAKTIYVNDYNGSVTQSEDTFDRNGNLLTWTMESHAYYSSEDELKLQYDLCSIYLFLNEYDGCKVSLNEKDGRIDFDLIVDFNKTDDDIYDLLDFPTTEQDYLRSITDGKYTIQKYKEFFGSIRVFDGFIT